MSKMWSGTGVRTVGLVAACVVALRGWPVEREACAQQPASVKTLGPCPVENLLLMPKGLETGGILSHTAWHGLPANPTYFAQAEVGRSAVMLAFADDLTKMATVGRKGSRFVVLVNGEAGPEFDEISPNHGLVFSEDGKRLAYVGVTEGKQHVVVDGVKGEGHEQVVSRLMFSPDGSRLAYIVTHPGAQGAYSDGRGEALVVDGQVQAPVSRIVAIRFSADSKRLAMLVEKEEGDDSTGRRRGKYVIEGKAEHPAIGEWLAFSPDGRLVFAVRDGEECRLFIDGPVGDKFDEITDVRFYGSSDLYTARARRAKPEHQRSRGDSSFLHSHEGFDEFVVIDGQVHKRGPSGKPWEPEHAKLPIHRTADGSVWAFVDSAPSSNGLGAYAVVTKDGRSAAYDQVHGVALSAESGASFVASKSGMVFFVRAGKESDGVAGQVKQSMRSPDGRRLAWTVEQPSGAVRMFLDGTGHGEYESISHALFSEDSQHLAYVGTRMRPRPPKVGGSRKDPPVTDPSWKQGASIVVNGREINTLDEAHLHMMGDAFGLWFSGSGGHVMYTGSVKSASQPGQRVDHSKRAVSLYRDDASIAELGTDRMELLTVVEEPAGYLGWKRPPGRNSKGRVLVANGREIGTFQLFASPVIVSQMNQQRTELDRWTGGVEHGIDLDAVQRSAKQYRSLIGDTSVPGEYRFVTAEGGEVKLVSFKIADLVK